MAEITSCCLANGDRQLCAAGVVAHNASQTFASGVGGAAAASGDMGLGGSGLAWPDERLVLRVTGRGFRV